MMMQAALLALALVGVGADKHDGIGMAVGEAEILSRPTPPPPPPNPALIKLIKKYNATRDAACAQVVSHIPSLDESTTTAFM